LIKSIKRLDAKVDEISPNAGLGGLLVYAISAGVLLMSLIYFIYFTITV
jgi:hypothetical protein